MNQQKAIILLKKLYDRARELSHEFESRRWVIRAKWMVVEIMTDYDFSQKEIAIYLNVNHSTISYYQNKYKPWPGERELLEKLKGEF